MSPSIPLLSAAAISLRVLAMGAKFSLSLYIAALMGLNELGLFGILSGCVAIVPPLVRMGLMSTLSRAAVTANPSTVRANLRRYSLFIGSIYTLITIPCLLASYLLHNLIFIIFPIVILSDHLLQDLYILSVLRNMLLRANLLLASGSIWSLVFMFFGLIYPPIRNIDTLIIFWAFGFFPALMLTRSPAQIPLPVISLQQYSRLRRWLQSLLPLSFPFYLSHVTTNLSYYADRFVLASLTDMKIVGAYVFFWQISSAVYNLANAGSIQPYVPLAIATYKNTGASALRILLRRCLRSSGTTILILSAASVAATPILIALSGTEYLAETSGVLYLLLGAQFLRIAGDVPGLFLLASSNERALAVSDVVALVLIVAMCSLSSVVIGIYGAAISVGLAYAIAGSYRLYAARTFTEA